MKEKLFQNKSKFGTASCYDNLHISYADDEYTMSVNDKELVINNNKKYTNSGYKSDMDKINKKEQPVNNTTNYNT
ncbi:hypothetical protein BCY92_06475 [Bacillus wiedmannii]|uniref:hypothetical protein n=1 Tax=Bacillus wiedmannii TaxID=1890302 RepID=UPI000E73019B|nr:hypothetical protein BCY92_06475 [Bacillus wiedmannii]